MLACRAVFFQTKQEKSRGTSHIFINTYIELLEVLSDMPTDDDDTIARGKLMFQYWCNSTNWNIVTKISGKNIPSIPLICH